MQNTMSPGRLYLGALWRRRRTLAGWVGGALLLGVVYLLLAEPVYETEVRVLIQQRGREADGTTSKTYDKEFLSTQAEVIHSPLTIAAACRALAEAAGEPLNEAELQEEVEDVADELRVTPLATTDIVRVAYQDADAARAAAMLREVLVSYRARVREDERAASEGSLELLSEREAALRGELTQLKSEYAVLRAAAPLVGESRDAVDLAATRVRDLSSQLLTVRGVLRQLEQTLSYINTLSEPLQADQVVPVLAAFDDPAARALSDAQQDLLQALTQLETARSVYQDRHPQRQAAERLAAAAETRLAEQTAVVVQSLRERLPLIKAEEQELTALLQEETQGMKSLDEALVRERHLAAEIEQKRELHHAAVSLLNDVQLADQAVAQGNGSIHVRVLDAFVVPEEPLWPQPAPLLAACAILSLLLGTLVVALQERLPLPGVLESARTAVMTGAATPERSDPDNGRDADLWAEVQRLRETVAAAGNGLATTHAERSETANA